MSVTLRLTVLMVLAAPLGGCALVRMRPFSPTSKFNMAHVHRIRPAPDRAKVNTELTGIEKEELFRRFSRQDAEFTAARGQVIRDPGQTPRSAQDPE